MTSESPLVMAAPINILPSSNSIAIKPEVRCLEKSISGVFFTVPLVVAMKMNWSSRYSDTGNIAVMRSPSSSGRMLTTGLPLAARLATGI